MERNVVAAKTEAIREQTLQGKVKVIGFERATSAVQPPFDI